MTINYIKDFIKKNFLGYIEDFRPAHNEIILHFDPVEEMDDIAREQRAELLQRLIDESNDYDFGDTDSPEFYGVFWIDGGQVTVLDDSPDLANETYNDFLEDYYD